MIKIFFSALIFTFLLSCKTSISSSSLEHAMNKIGVDTVLITPSQGIDEYPLWSPNSDSISANIEGHWYKFSLAKASLQEGAWHQQKVGILTSAKSDLLKQSEKEEFDKLLNYDGRKIIVGDENILELRLKGFSTSLITTQKSQDQKILWSTELENCHSLSLSPNEKYVAYICELSGLFVIKTSAIFR